MGKVQKHILIIALVVAFFGAIVLSIVLPGRVTARVLNGYLEINCYHIGGKTVASKTLDLSDCEIIFYEDFFEEGDKIDGLSLVRIKSGNYKNDSLGEYSLSRYKKNKSVIIIKSDYSNTVFNLKTYDKTFRFYGELLAMIAAE